MLHRHYLLQLQVLTPCLPHWPLCNMQKHGQKTAYAFMVDADFAVNGTWRLRLASQRMQLECQYRCSAPALPGCMIWAPTQYFAPVLILPVVVTPGGL